jgi:SAM-dependent methyltransferase
MSRKIDPFVVAVRYGAPPCLFLNNQESEDFMAVPQSEIVAEESSGAQFSYFREHYTESVDRMFAAVTDLYAEYWNDLFHFAIFENDEESWETAFARTHRRYLEALRAQDAAKLLDLACGRGGFARILAGSTSGSVLGIDLSRAQIARCQTIKRSNLSFRHHDIMTADAMGETFDAVSLLDAECYLPDKKRAIETISRIVRPGGRFLLVAWCKQEGLSRIQEELVLHPFMRYWAVPDLVTVEQYRLYLDRSGFRLIEDDDLTDRVRRNWDFGYTQALKGVQDISASRMAQMLWKRAKLGAEGIRLIKEQFPAALYIKTAFDAGFLRYNLLLAEKL